jgi:signal transduction histidine kinase
MGSRARFRSLRNRLALLFFAITAGAFAVIYFTVVPQLQSSLERQALDDLRRGAAGARSTIQGLSGATVQASQVDQTVRAAGDGTDSRVTLIGVQQSASPVPPASGPRLYVISDSSAERSVPPYDEIARRAVRSRRVETGFATFDGAELGQIAQPIEFRGDLIRVALYSRSLEDVGDTVSFVRRRILVATGIALLLATIGGWLIAERLARRVRRLELGARQLAAGSFIEPLPVDSDDELGHLTSAFNDMQVRLRQVDVARKEFIATASHELRTPIFSLAGFVELLLDEDLDDPTRSEFLETMREQVERLQKLSVDLLDLSRLDAGSMEMRPEQVDLADLARSVVGEFRPAVQRHGTELRVRLPEGGVDAHCDPERVTQIMRILLDNALRHTPEGTRVTVSAERDNGAAAFTVADAGPGLGPGEEHDVFERFHTGDAARGAGLGLAIAEELAERMDGRLTVRSAPGRTAFTLALPLMPGSDGARS